MTAAARIEAQLAIGVARWETNPDARRVVDSATRLFCLAEELTHIRRMSRAAIAAEMRAIAKALVE
jgi:hypothetical protein